ncbi:hypothetical protein NDN08_008250 [Rhodosorus marinus]|uniref:Uncharacterized protein n=1 Tax=Rhodosorus marinus TaxID=101924 RepID=A0AAV8V4K7_9RHOD|nr:hypothetical protein NDN08_008250 [Rhodosorus marinus]
MESGGESGAERVQMSMEKGSEPSVPFLWSFGDEFVATIALISLFRTIFYVTRSRTGRSVKKESAMFLLKYWVSFYLLRLVFELLEDLAPGLEKIFVYQVYKVVFFTVLSIMSLGVTERFFDKVVSPQIEDRKDEIAAVQVEFTNGKMQLHSYLIDLVEYSLGWLKRRFIMEGGDVSLEPRQIVLDPDEARALNGEREPGLLPRLPASLEPGITTFSGGADIGARRGRSMSSRTPEEREIRARLGLSLVQGKGEVSSARKRNQKEPQDKYEKLKLLRKQMKEGAFSQTSD